MPFKDFIGKFNYDPETFKPDEFIAALEREYEADESAWTAKLTTTESALQERDKLITEQKTQLWDYYTKSGTPIDPTNNASGANVPPPEGDPNEYVPKGVSSLFGDKKE